MRFRRALIGLIACCAAPNAVLAQPARTVELSYEITFLGLTGFRIDFSGRFAGNSYDVQSHTFKQGLIKAVTVHYEGRNRATGIVAPSGGIPTGGSLSIVVGDKARTWAVTYGPGGTLQAIGPVLDRPTSLAFIGTRTYVTTLDGEVWQLYGPGRPGFCR